ncbi:MAG: YfbR-like 5'-deoxynucleotidase [Bacteroidota bacterium]
MEETLVTALGKIIIMNRWNVMPKIEIWTEAENIAYYTHMAFAIAKEGFSWDDTTIEILLKRCLLKSLNKYILSDISVTSRDKMREINKNLWETLVNDTALKSADLFPREVRGEFREYLTYSGDYKIGSDNAEEIKQNIENLISFCQFKSALEECEINMQVYKNERYKKIKADIENKIKALPKKNLDVFETSLDRNQVYIHAIRQLKNLRRWNTINRSIETTVMGHTFIVAILALLFAELDGTKTNLRGENFTYRAVLRALCHDVPESFTGDVITPVKVLIEKYEQDAWDKVEKALIADFQVGFQRRIVDELNAKGLLVELTEKELFSVDSLVKACDQLALIIECLFEREWGSNRIEMKSVYENYTQKLQNSEWESIREYAHSILIDYPRE